MELQPSQCRMARAALGWSTEELAKRAGVGRNTVNRFEQGSPGIPATRDALRRELEAGGVIFLAAGETIDGGPGVRLRSS